MKAAGILMVIGGIITLIYGIALAALGAMLGSLVGGLAGAGGAGAALGATAGVVFVIFGILTILAAVWYPKKPGWGWLALVLAQLTLIMPFGGFWIGPFLTTVGAALGLKEGSGSRRR